MSILLPQHMAKYMDKGKGMEAWEIMNKSATTLHWNNGTDKQTIPLNSSTKLPLLTHCREPVNTEYLRQCIIQYTNQKY